MNRLDLKPNTYWVATYGEPPDEGWEGVWRCTQVCWGVPKGVVGDLILLACNYLSEGHKDEGTPELVRKYKYFSDMKLVPTTKEHYESLLLIYGLK